MSTATTRLNISVSHGVRDALAKLARRDHMPQATKATRLLEIALEIEEDYAWDKMARKRDTKNARFVPHAHAWK